MSGRLHWAKFSWDHWENDPALSLCSLAAQGLWMRMLCIAQKHDGYLLVAGAGPSAEQLSRLVRSTPAEVEGLLAELESGRVFSRDSKGVIFSRRSVADVKSSRINQQNGKLGGNPTLRKDTENTATLKAERNPRLKAEKKREEKKREDSPQAPQGAGTDEIWRISPQVSRDRSSKAAVSKALAAAALQGDEPSTVLAGLKGFFASDEAMREDGQFIAGLHRLIEGDRWRDFAERAAADHPSNWPAERWGPLVAGWSRDGSWASSFGPKPGEPGCLVPQQAIDDVGADQTKWSDRHWDGHLTDLRNHQKWRERCGPKPGERGCMVPARLLIAAHLPPTPQTAQHLGDR